MSTVPRLTIDIALVFLGLSGMIGLYRAVLSRSVTEQIVVLEFLLGLIVAGIALDVIEKGRSPLIDVMLIVAIVGLVSSVGFTRFLKTDQDEGPK